MSQIKENTEDNPWSAAYIDTLPVPGGVRMMMKRALKYFPVQDFSALTKNEDERIGLMRKIAQLPSPSTSEIPEFIQQAVSHLISAQSVGGLNVYANSFAPKTDSRPKAPTKRYFGRAGRTPTKDA